MNRILMSLLAVGTLAAAAADTPFRLSSLQWTHRVLLVFAPSEQDPGYLRQQEEWKRAMDGMKERDLLLVPLILGQPGKAAGMAIGTEDQQKLRQELRVPPDGFTVMLIGRDGGVKLRQQEPADAMRLFALIDSMPMRREEMRRKAAAPRR